MDTPTTASNTNGYHRRLRERPRRVTLLALGVLILTGSNALRAVGALRSWDFLAELQVISPLYQIISGSFWTLAGLLVWWALWRGRPWAPQAALAFTAGYILYFWIDRLFLVVPQEPFTAWPFYAGYSVLLLALVAWIVTRPRARAHFNRR
jgi:hypothetical protein